MTSSIKRSAASGFDQSYIIRGSGLENTWNRQSANPSPGVTLDLAYGLKWDCPYHGDRCWELHGKGRGLCQEGKGLPLLFDSTGRQEIQGSLSIFLSSSCSIPQINGQSPKGSIAHACLWIETLSVAIVQPQTLPVNSQSRLMSKLTHNV